MHTSCVLKLLHMLTNFRKQEHKPIENTGATNRND